MTRVTATDVAEFLEQAEAVDVHTLAREGMPEALDYLHRRQAHRFAAARPPRQAGLRRAVICRKPEMTRVAPSCRHGSTSIPRANPQVTGTRHVNRV